MRSMTRSLTLAPRAVKAARGSRRYRAGQALALSRPGRCARLAIGDMERAGVDIITDGEIRRESYSNRFATALAGVDLDNPATVRGRTSGTVVVPRIVGPIRRLRP